MLVPAESVAEEVTRLFKQHVYDDDYFYYVGYSHEHAIHDFFTPINYSYRWAIMSNNEVVGYFEYKVDVQTDCAYAFGLYSFKKSNVIGVDVGKKFDELIRTYHRIEFRMICGNPVQRHYDKLFIKYTEDKLENDWYGYRFILHDVTKDPKGNYHDEIIYEIIRKKN